MFESVTSCFLNITKDNENGLEDGEKLGNLLNGYYY